MLNRIIILPNPYFPNSIIHLQPSPPPPLPLPFPKKASGSVFGILSSAIYIFPLSNSGRYFLCGSLILYVMAAMLSSDFCYLRHMFFLRVPTSICIYGHWQRKFLWEGVCVFCFVFCVFVFMCVCVCVCLSAFARVCVRVPVGAWVYILYVLVRV